MNQNTYTYPASMLSRVLLPAPDGPRIAVSSPPRIFPLTPRRTGFQPEK